MPYIKAKDRYELVFEGKIPVTPGELNFLFTHYITEFLELQGESYTTLNACIGALECCKLELYRRLAVPYEEKKIIENGDVY